MGNPGTSVDEEFAILSEKAGYPIIPANIYGG